MHRLSQGAKDKIYSLLAVDMALGQAGQRPFEESGLRARQSYADPLLAETLQLVQDLKMKCRSDGLGLHRLQEDMWYGMERVAQLYEQH